MPAEPATKAFILDTGEIAERLNVAMSTLSGWLRADQARRPEDRVFDFHRWRGRSRYWSEEGFQKLEMAIHRESQVGVLARWRTRRSDDLLSPPDPDADASLDQVLSRGIARRY
jgi:hypothetical protein